MKAKIGNNRRTIVAMSTMIFVYMNVFADDCITLKTRKEICGKLELTTEIFWKKSEVIIDDTLNVSLGDVQKMRYGDKVLVRASAGDMLSNFAIQKYEGRLSIYEQRNSFQSGAQTFFNVNTKYFSIDADSLYYFNLENLRRHIHDSPASEKHLRIAYTKKWIAAGIRVASIIPFMVGIRKAQDEQTQRYLIPFGIGALMITVPLFTIRPSVRKDMQKAIEEYNTKI